MAAAIPVAFATFGLMIIDFYQTMSLVKHYTIKAVAVVFLPLATWMTLILIGSIDPGGVIVWFVD